MKKRLFAIAMSVCLLFVLFSLVASAASVDVEPTLPATVKFCPGTVIGDATTEKLPEPVVYGSVYSQGWEIKKVDGDWVPYDGTALDASYDGAQIRYFAAPYSNDASEYVYSNESTMIVKHNPTGKYLYSGSHHWRTCADCGGGEDDKVLHSFFDASGTQTGSATACTVCGAHRTPQWTGLAAFFEWLFALIGSLLG